MSLGGIATLQRFNLKNIALYPAVIVLLHKSVLAEVPRIQHYNIMHLRLLIEVPRKQRKR